MGCLQGKKRHTLGGAKMHFTKLLKSSTKKRKTIMNCTIHGIRSSMLDLQVVDLASNKENFPPALNTQRKRVTTQLN